MNMTLADLFAYGLTLLQFQIMSRNIWMILDDINNKKDPDCPGELFEIKDFAIQVFVYFTTIAAVASLMLVGEKPVFYN